MLFSPARPTVAAETTTAGLTLITGAAGGIGRAFAEGIAAREGDLVLVDRFPEPLEELARSLRRRHNVKVIVLPQDLSAADGPQQVFNSVQQRKLHISQLINNAAVGIHAPLEDQPPERIEEMVQVNILSVVKLTQLFLAQMKERNSGTIVNVSSSGIFDRCPWWSVYAATKAFVLHFTESIQTELAESEVQGVHVVAVCPGMTRTGFFENAGTEAPDRDVQTPEEVVSEVLRGLDRHQPLIVTGWSNRLRVHTERASLRRFLSGVKRGLRRVAMLS